MAVPTGSRGKLVQCPTCRKRIRVPSNPMQGGESASGAGGGQNDANADDAPAPAPVANETSETQKRKAG